MKIISTDELCRRLRRGPVALFDVRGDVEFERGHIPGAKTAPLGSLTFRIARVMHPDSFVAVYSNGGNCDLAARATERLEDLGLRNVHCYASGLLGWRAARQPLVESAEAKIHTRGPVRECRRLLVDVEHAYGGVFQRTRACMESAGG